MKTKQQSGFTLIEVVVYLALFAILFGGVLAAVFSVIESSGRNQSRAMMQEEGEFLLAKINWAVSNASMAQVPAEGQLLTTVSGDRLEFEADGENLFLKRYDDMGQLISEQPLNNSTVQVTKLFFKDISVTGNGEKGINYGFDLNSNTPNGMILTSHFESSVYLRK